jgi:hypothetical protein
MRARVRRAVDSPATTKTRATRAWPGGPALYRAIDAVRQGSRDSPQLLYWLALACEGATILGDEARLHELSSRMEAAARQHGTTLTLALALCHAGVWDLLAGDERRPPGQSVDEEPSAVKTVNVGYLLGRTFAVSSPRHRGADVQRPKGCDCVVRPVVRVETHRDLTGRPRPSHPDDQLLQESFVATGGIRRPFARPRMQALAGVRPGGKDRVILQRLWCSRNLLRS